MIGWSDAHTILKNFIETLTAHCVWRYLALPIPFPHVDHKYSEQPKNCASISPKHILSVRLLLPIYSAPMYRITKIFPTNFRNLWLLLYHLFLGHATVIHILLIFYKNFYFYFSFNFRFTATNTIFQFLLYIFFIELFRCIFPPIQYQVKYNKFGATNNNNNSNEWTK